MTAWKGRVLLSDPVGSVGCKLLAPLAMPSGSSSLGWPLDIKFRGRAPPGFVAVILSWSKMIGVWQRDSVGGYLK